MLSVTALDLNGAEHKVQYDRRPDRCPLCHHAIDPLEHDVATIVGGGPSYLDTRLELVFQCTRHKCFHLFIGSYSRDYDTNLRLNTYFSLKGTAPTAFVDPPIHSDIAECSPMFTTIFCQAAAAEEAGLDQVAGVGYRKSLEFLIKDYCILVHPNDAEQIKAAFLGTVISRWVDDPRLKECVRRATWLGNDETHYVRRWEDKELSDLKLLIDLTSFWIASSLLTSRYLEEMPGGS